MGEIITKILEDANALSELDIRRAEVALGSVRAGAKVLGTVHSDDTRRLYAVSHWYSAEAGRAFLSAAFDCVTNEQVKEFTLSGSRANIIAHIAMELFWAEARNDIGGTAWQKGTDLDIREGWTLIATPSKPQFSLPDLLAHIARSHEGDSESEDE